MRLICNTLYEFEKFINKNKEMIDLLDIKTEKYINKEAFGREFEDTKIEIEFRYKRTNVKEVEE